MAKQKTTKVFIAALLGIFLFAGLAQAALVNCGGNGTVGGVPQAPCTIGDMIGTIKLIVNFLLSWAWLISILFIVVAGIQMVMAGGNQETLTKAKTSLSHAIVGFIIILCSFVLINLVVGLLTGAGGLDPAALMNAFLLVP